MRLTIDFCKRSFATCKNSYSQCICKIVMLVPTCRSENMFSVTMIFTITINHKVGDCILFFEDETSEGRKRYYNES